MEYIWSMDNMGEKLAVTLAEEDNVIIDGYEELNLLAIRFKDGEELCRYRLEKIK